APERDPDAALRSIQRDAGFLAGRERWVGEAGREGLGKLIPQPPFLHFCPSPSTRACYLRHSRLSDPAMGDHHRTQSASRPKDLAPHRRNGAARWRSRPVEPSGISYLQDLPGKWALSA